MSKYDDLVDKLEEFDENFDHITKLLERLEKKLDAVLAAVKK